MQHRPTQNSSCTLQCLDLRLVSRFRLNKGFNLNLDVEILSALLCVGGDESCGDRPSISLRYTVLKGCICPASHSDTLYTGVMLQ